MPLTACLEKHQHNTYTLHQQRLAHIKPTIDNRINTTTHTQHLKHRQYAHSRQTAVDIRHNLQQRRTVLENIRLYHRINDIHNGSGSGSGSTGIRPYTQQHHHHTSQAQLQPLTHTHTSTHSAPTLTPASHHHHHSTERDKQLLHICLENDRLVNRLLNVKPSKECARTEQLKQYRYYEQKIKQHSKFRVNSFIGLNRGVAGLQHRDGSNSSPTSYQHEHDGAEQREDMYKHTHAARDTHTSPRIYDPLQQRAVDEQRTIKSIVQYYEQRPYTQQQHHVQHHPSSQRASFVDEYGR